MALADEIRRVNQNVFEIETKLRQLVTEVADVTFSLVDPLTGDAIPITHESLPKIKQNFEVWKTDFQGNLDRAGGYIELQLFVSPDGAGTGSSETDPTHFANALKVLPKLSKYDYVSIVFLEGTYSYPTTPVLIPHMTNYVKLKASPSATTQPVISLDYVEVWGAARFSVENMYVIINGQSANSGGIECRDNASLFFNNTTIEAANALHGILVRNGGTIDIRNSTVIGGGTNNAITVSRGDMTGDTVTIDQANVGLLVQIGGRVYRTNFTYTANVTTTESVDAYSVVQP